METKFELWARKESERLALLRECLEAVVAGRLEITLHAERYGLLRKRQIWRILATLDLSTGPRVYSRGPVDPADYESLFEPEAIQARAGGNRPIVSRRFPPW